MHAYAEDTIKETHPHECAFSSQLNFLREELTRNKMPVERFWKKKGHIWTVADLGKFFKEAKGCPPFQKKRKKFKGRRCNTTIVILVVSCNFGCRIYLS